MKNASVLLLTALCATSCTFGPDWKSPEMSVPETFRGKTVGTGTMADLPWQTVLKDKHLEALLNDVFKANHDLSALAHNVDAAREYVTIARVPLFPWAGYSASTSKGMNSQGGAGIAQTGGITTNPGSAALSASWELDLWGKNRRSVESAAASAAAAQENLHNLRISLLRQAACGYLQLLMLDEQLRIAHSAVENYRKSLELFEAQQTYGMTSGLETASAQAALAAAEADIPALEIQITELENTLSVLAGRAPGRIARGGRLSSFAAASKVASGIPADVLARRPDIRAREQELRAANAEIGIAIANYFPSISLTAAGGYASADLRRGISTHRTGWGIGANADGNIVGILFESGRLRATTRARKAEFLAAKDNYEQAVLSAMSEIATTLTQREKLVQVMHKQEEAVAAYRKSVELSMIRFKAGTANYYEVLQSQMLLFPAEKQLAAYRYQYAATIPTLYTQLGGGWK
ncbi:MAG: efflux transporter outer membrane subunit [Akkermansiaceae bacterium]|nr:efflux transporter outer membrane subunit [Akkermansiaceae bacterium]